MFSIFAKLKIETKIELWMLHYNNTSFYSISCYRFDCRTCVAFPRYLIGASLSEPHASVTSLHSSMATTHKDGDHSINSVAIER